MSLAYEGQPIAQCSRTQGINAIVFCTESIVIPPFSNAKIQCKAPKLKFHSGIAPSIIFEPSFRHRSSYVDCHTYEGLVTFDKNIANSGSFNIVMTNNSSRFVKITKNQTLGMLKSCDSDQICTIHRIVTSESKSLQRDEIKPDYTKDSQTVNSINIQNTNNTSTKPKTITKVFYRIPTRNKHGDIEVLTLLKDNVPSMNKITYTVFEEEFISHPKPVLQDAPIDQKIKLELEQLLERNQDCFAEDERQIGTTPLITMSIDTGDHPPVVKRPYTLALKHHDWVTAEIDKLLEAGVIRERDSSWSAPIAVVPKGDGKDYTLTIRALNAITRTFIWPMPRVEDFLAKLGKAKFSTTLDLRSGYHHIALDKESIKKTAFCTPFGKYEYLKVPFGLAQAPSYFQKLMNKVLDGLNFAFAYLDDIIIFSNTAEENLRHI